MTLPRTHFGIADRGASEVINADLSEYFNTIHGIMTFAKPYKRRFSKRRRLYGSDAPGARWLNQNGNPHYAHADCTKGPILCLEPHAYSAGGCG